LSHAFREDPNPYDRGCSANMWRNFIGPRPIPSILENPALNQRLAVGTNSAAAIV